MSHLCSGCFTEIEPWATLCRSCQVEPEGAAPLPDDLLALAVDDVSAASGVAPEALLGQLVGRDHSTIHYGVNGKTARSAP